MGEQEIEVGTRARGRVSVSTPIFWNTKSLLCLFCLYTIRLQVRRVELIENSDMIFQK